jgi:hypothetical protein
MGKRKLIFTWLSIAFFALLVTAPSMAASKKASTLVGKETWNFNLTSTQDRLFNYGDEYYGKAYLIMTFFPAAFTPV